MAGDKSACKFLLPNDARFRRYRAPRTSIGDGHKAGGDYLFTQGLQFNALVAPRSMFRHGYR